MTIRNQQTTTSTPDAKTERQRLEELKALLLINTPAELESFADSLADKVAAKLANQRRLVDRPTLAKIVSLSVPTIDRLESRGEIPVVRNPSITSVLYDPSDVITAMKKGGVA